MQILWKWLVLVFTLLFAACAVNSPKDQPDPETPRSYELTVLVVSWHPATYGVEVASHFRQSSSLNTTVEIVGDWKFLDSLSMYDLIYIADDVPALTQDQTQVLEALDRFASRGGLLYLEPDCVTKGFSSILGLQNPQSLTPRLEFPSFVCFPGPLHQFEVLLRAVSESPSLDPPSLYERLLLPSFVHTQPVNSTWSVRATGEVVACQALVSSDAGHPLLTWRPRNRGGILWSADFSKRFEAINGHQVRRDFRLGYPDPLAKNFHYGRASTDFMFRDQLVSLAAKLKYGFAITRLFGPNGSVGCCWQNHLDGIDNWQEDYIGRWYEILKERGLIPSVTINPDLKDAP